MQFRLARLIRLILVLASACLAQSDLCSADQPDEEPLVKPADRLVLVGPTMIERMQRHSYLDTELALRTRGKLQTRNLGWSGDTVFGISRAVFGTQEVGFGRLVNDVAQAKPTVVLLAYGRNEAQEGAASAAAFETQYRLLAKTIVEKTEARLIFLQPRKIERLGTPFPSPTQWNRDIDSYRDVIRSIATDLKSPVIESTPTDDWTLTANGLHPTPAGYLQYTSWLADQLVGPRQAAAAVAINLADKKGEQEYELKIPGKLPPPAVPQGKPGGNIELKITGLEAGTYQLLSNGASIHSATSAEWSKGRTVADASGGVTTEKIRQLAIAKNELYFHRYRPQNETYLFLFRKHEQGNNAVEIPQYEPLVESVEQQIRELTKPTMTEFRLLRIR